MTDDDWITAATKVHPRQRTGGLSEKRQSDAIMSTAPNRDPNARHTPSERPTPAFDDPSPLIIAGADGDLVVMTVRDAHGWRVRVVGDATLTAGEMATICQALTVKAAEAAERNRRETD